MTMINGLRIVNSSELYIYNGDGFYTLDGKKLKENNMNTATIREKIRYATLSKDERVLRESGILSDSGNLTDVGRRVFCDVLIEDEATRKAIVKLVEKTLPKEKK